MATQTRITERSHETLVRISRQMGKPLVEVIDIALQALERQLFLERVNDGYEELRSRPKDWTAGQTERNDWDVTLEDGIEE